MVVYHVHSCVHYVTPNNPYVPLITGGEKKMSELITFYKVGLGGRNEVQPTTGWVIRTLGTLLANHNATDVSKCTSVFNEHCVYWLV